MDFSVWKGIKLISVLGDWATKTVQDQKITPQEAAKLLTTVLDMLGIPTSVEVDGDGGLRVQHKG